MVCSTPSVKNVADKTAAAKNQVDKLQKMIEEQREVHEKEFFDRVTQSCIDAGVTDARQIGYNFNIKTEYTSEFSLDAIVGVVTAALEAVIAAKDPTTPSPATSPESIRKYCDVVVAVAEAAKSSSTASASLSYSMNRLGPGLYAFLFASSVNIKDEDTFGTEAVSTTIVFYRLMESIDEVKNHAQYDEAVSDAKNLMKAKALQAQLMDRLANGEIDIETWTKLDMQYNAMVETWRERLAAHKIHRAEFTASAGRTGDHADEESPEAVEASNFNKQCVISAIGALSASDRHESCRVAIEISNRRLAENYY